MAHKILVKDTVTGQCGLADPPPAATPHTTVVAGTGGVTVVPGGTPAAPTVTINTPVTSLTDNGDGTMTFVNELGAANVIDICALMSGLPNVGPLQP